MSIGSSIRNLATKLLLVFLIFSQISNALQVTNLLDFKEKIVLNNEVDNNSKEDKNNTDISEESKIFEQYFSPVFFLNESSITNHIVQNFTEVLNAEDLPPPEFNS